MCGFLGIILKASDAKPDVELGREMLNTLRHRGPDGEGIWSEGNAFLGHRRLSIIDTGEGGRQPYLSESGNVIVVFNGEIYNYRDLRKDLLRRGHRFIGQSDGEVLPHLYEDYGPGFVSLLRGMYSLAVFDVIRNRLFLVRDRVGIKPLYYSRTSDAILFGSEIKSLLRHPSVSREVDYQAVHDYLTLAFIQEPATGFKSVASLLPGHVLRYEAGEVKITRHWSYSPGRDGARVGDDELRSELNEAVSLQLHADVPLGAMRSGGVDSSLVTAVACACSGETVSSYTVQFEEKGYDESLYAAAVAEAVGAKHAVLHIGEGYSTIEEMDFILEHFDQPFGDSSAIPTYRISREMRATVKVALSGDGGDELFYGYPDFAYLSTATSFKPLLFLLTPGMVSMASGLMKRSHPDVVRYLSRAQRFGKMRPEQVLADMRSYISEADKADVYTDDGRCAFYGVDPTYRIFSPYAELLSDSPKDGLGCYLLQNSLPGDMLKKVDMMSMASGLEVRVPLLDERIVCCAERIPSQAKHRFGKGKLPLKNQLQLFVPEQIVTRRKQGFGIPFDRFVRREHHAYVDDLLRGPSSTVGRMFRRAWLDALIAGFVGGNPNTHDISRFKVYQLIFMLLSLEIWFRRKVRIHAG